MKTGEWLAKHPTMALTISGDASLKEAARLLLDHPEQRDVFVVDEDGRVRGHLGFRHVSTLLLAELRPSHSPRELVERITLGTVAAHMDDHVMCAGAGEDIGDIFHRHMEQRVENIPVVDDERRLLGVIRLVDLLRNAIDQTPGPARPG